jgi:ubiquinone/menaquinone biosynthesis C-methylase UbiE
LSKDNRLLNHQFPRSNAYEPDWVLERASGGANSIWLVDWLTSIDDAARPHPKSKEYDVTVWATDLWFSPSENLKRIRDAGFIRNIYPIHADARTLPFASDFFDAIVSIDAFPYFGTDDHYLNY